MASKTGPTASPEQVRAFIASLAMPKTQIETLLGFSPTTAGRNIRRWEEEGAPSTASLLMAYIAYYGSGLAQDIVDGDGSVILQD